MKSKDRSLHISNLLGLDGDPAKLGEVLLASLLLDTTSTRDVLTTAAF